MTSGAVSLWVAGAEQAERAAELIARARPLGHRPRRGTRRMPTRFEPAGPLRGTLRPPADKSISHRAALIAAMAEGETRDRGLPRRRRHPLDPRRGRGARRPGRGRRRRSAPDDPRSPASACRAPAAPRSTSATPAPCCGCCRAGSRGSRAGPGSSTATSRSAAARSTGSPSRCGGWAPRSAAARTACRRSAIEGAPLTRHRLRAAGRQRPGQVVPALRRPARRGRDPGASSRCRPATTPSAC